MNPETVEYIKHRRALADEANRVAEAALADGHLHSAVNRLYYACFYTVSALLLAEGHVSSKHSGIRSLFNQHWIKPHRLPAEMSSFYKGLFASRHRGDYDDLFEFSRRDVEEWFEKAQAFMERISAEIERLLA